MQEQVEEAFPGWQVLKVHPSRFDVRKGRLFHLIVERTQGIWSVSDVQMAYSEACAEDLHTARNNFLCGARRLLQEMEKAFAPAPVPDPQLGPQWAHEPDSTLWTLKYAGGELQVIPLSNTQWKVSYCAGPHGGQGYGATAQEALGDLRGVIEDRMKELLEEKDAHGAALEALECLRK